MSYDPGVDFGRLCDEAQRAPSVFNNRPWWFEYRPPDHIDLWLRAVDKPNVPLDKARAREYVISCGAALFNLRLAIRVTGHDLVMWLLPKPNYADPMHPPTLLASVEIVTGRVKKAGTWEQALHAAIKERHTSRQPYTIRPAPLPIITTMEHAAAHEGAYLRLIHPPEARRWMRQAARVDKAFTPPFPNYVSSADYGPPPKNRYPRTRKDFWQGEEQRFERRPQLMALSTDDDTTVAWLQAGQALQRAILEATRYSDMERYRLRYHAHDEARHGVSVSFLTQPLESYDIAGQARRWPWRSRYAEVPQMIIRVGYAPERQPEKDTSGKWSQPPVGRPRAPRGQPEEDTSGKWSQPPVERPRAPRGQPEEDTSGEWSQPPVEPPPGALRAVPSPRTRHSGHDLRR
jgi:hypothetical protein